MSHIQITTFCHPDPNPAVRVEWARPRIERASRRATKVQILTYTAAAAALQETDAATEKADDANWKIYRRRIAATPN